MIGVRFAAAIGTVATSEGRYFGAQMSGGRRQRRREDVDKDGCQHAPDYGASLGGFLARLAAAFETPRGDSNLRPLGLEVRPACTLVPRWYHGHLRHTTEERRKPR